MKEPWEQEIEYRKRLDKINDLYHCCEECGNPLVDGGYNLEINGKEFWCCEDCMRELYWHYNCEL